MSDGCFYDTSAVYQTILLGDGMTDPSTWFLPSLMTTVERAYIIQTRIWKPLINMKLYLSFIILWSIDHLVVYQWLWFDYWHRHRYNVKMIHCIYVYDPHVIDIRNGLYVCILSWSFMSMADIKLILTFLRFNRTVVKDFKSLQKAQLKAFV